MTFLEMCIQGLIKDFGIAMSNVELVYHEDGNWHQRLLFRI
jgi:hypothetical protein